MTDFRGIALPVGVEKRILYHSTFRVIATYAMSLADLDRELQHVLKARGTTIKEDCRQGLSGRSECIVTERHDPRWEHTPKSHACVLTPVLSRTQLMSSPPATSSCMC